MVSKKIRVLPLTEEEYTAAFKTFCSKTTEYERMLDMMKPVVESFKGEAINLMSIGAGTGCFENDLVTKLGLNVSYFHAVEPSKDRGEQLKKKVISWDNTKLIVDQNYFTKNYETELKFDLILMSHCLYSIDNVDQVILGADYMRVFSPGWNFSPPSRGEIGVRLYESFQPGLKLTTVSAPKSFEV